MHASDWRDCLLSRQTVLRWGTPLAPAFLRASLAALRNKSITLLYSVTVNAPNQKIPNQKMETAWKGVPQFYHIQLTLNPIWPRTNYSRLNANLSFRNIQFLLICYFDLLTLPLHAEILRITTVYIQSFCCVILTYSCHWKSDGCASWGGGASWRL